MLRSLLLALVLAVSAASPVPATVVKPQERLEDPEMEARAQQLYGDLRCLVCQNQSIRNSNAEHAADMRAVVRERIRAGDTNAEIKDYLTGRYGDFVLLSPPVKPETYALWFGPPALVAVGVFGIGVYFWRRRRGGDDLPRGGDGLDPDEQARLDAILKEQDEPR